MTIEALSAEFTAMTMSVGAARTPDHKYFWNGDGPIPSVTTVKDVLDKSGPLVGWAKAETAACAVRNYETLGVLKTTAGDAAAVDWLKKIPDYQRDKAADMGTSIHVAAEHIILGVSQILTPEQEPFVAAYRKFLTTWEPQFLLVEAMVFSLRHHYAGTLDAVAVIDGETWLLDWKTSKGVYGDMAIQLAAYGNADFVGYEGDPTEYAIPPIDRYGIVHIRPDMDEALLIPMDVDGAFEVFLDLRRPFEFRQTDRKRVGKPMQRRAA